MSFCSVLTNKMRTLINPEIKVGGSIDYPEVYIPLKNKEVFEKVKNFMFERGYVYQDCGQSNDLQYMICTFKKGLNYKSNVTKINESQLRNIIKESIIQVLKESKPTKLTQSFKSKEDMTDYRDMYDPESEDYEENGPYMPYSYTVCDDGYDYCGDDIYNDMADEHNRSLKKKLATKGGQMSDDWSRFAPKEYDKKRKDNELEMGFEKIKKRNEYPEDTLRSSSTIKNKWVNGRRSDGDIEDHWDFMSNK